MDIEKSNGGVLGKHEGGGVEGCIPPGAAAVDICTQTFLVCACGLHLSICLYNTAHTSNRQAETRSCHLRSGI